MHKCFCDEIVHCENLFMMVIAMLNGLIFIYSYYFVINYKLKICK